MAHREDVIHIVDALIAIDDWLAVLLYGDAAVYHYSPHLRHLRSHDSALPSSIRLFKLPLPRLGNHAFMRQGCSASRSDLTCLVLECVGWHPGELGTPAFLMC